MRACLLSCLVTLAHLHSRKQTCMQVRTLIPIHYTCRFYPPSAQRELEFKAGEQKLTHMLKLLNGADLSDRHNWEPADDTCARLLRKSIYLMQLALWEKFGGANR